ncbi:accessory gene regulator B family protein [Paraclostridium ghonii]|uniref:accessory gene regulator ArgB-like protein n=1 Tax=Paraclostridium ghonii TaxID=29358 RepID=UPI00202CB1AC|nr:accessory gene regulator B family protein [Paeniclostridium ghonii]MCM0164840.1 accessory gene regulator B family protein [Paeniclostridium ghonii]
MAVIENISYNISNKIGSKANKTKEEIEIMNYGLFIWLHTVLAFLSTVLVGIIIGKTIEVVLITIVASSLKKFSGGVHATSPNRCLIIGIITALILTYISVLFNKYGGYSFIYVFSIVSIISCYYIFYKKAPIGTKNKPLKKESTRKKLRKKLFKRLNMYIIIIILLLIFRVTGFLNYDVAMFVYCIELGIILQTIAITKLGETIILKLDCFLK